MTTAKDIEYTPEPELEYNPVIDTDSYKSSHPIHQYQPGTKKMFSYIASRGGEYRASLMMGLQMILQKYFRKPVTMAQVEEAREFFEAHGEPFPYDGWKYVVEKLDGKIPLRIRAVPEGLLIPTGNVLVTVESTDENCFWMVGWMETKLMRVWYPITVATQSFFIKEIILDALKQSADDPMSEINFKLHDFGSRGVGDAGQAAIGGAAHLANFMGSDTCIGVRQANFSYDCKMAAFSIEAAEHSTITSWGRDHEVDAYRNMVRRLKPGKLVAVVSDSFDLFQAIEQIWCEDLLEEIKESGGTIVIRPDSGVPHEIVLEALRIIDRKIGCKKNMKGYKVLPPYFRILQGDGVNRESIRLILKTIMDAGFSASNIAFGCGGQLLQMVNRDTLKFAMKCSWVLCDGAAVEVFKDPKTDHGKRSKKGIVDLVIRNGEYVTLEHLPADQPVQDSVLKLVYDNGRFFNRVTLDEIRARANRALLES